MITIHNMKKILYIFLIAIIFTGVLSTVYSFVDQNTQPPNMNSIGPIDSSSQAQIKNATLALDGFLGGITNYPIQISASSPGNMSINTIASNPPLSDVRLVVGGEIIGSTLSGTDNHPLCIGSTNGSEVNGYPLVKCP